ncbi:MAG: ROK family transcriptional regulator [Bacteroidales bacterium]|nr:ROK family transcriptional regulator [Bacteroidales bacterium]
MLKIFENITNNTKDALNKRKIIKQFINDGDMTLNNLASNINLSIPTVTRIINEMIDEKYIQDLGKLKTAEGRHPNLYGLNAEAAYFIGVDIEHFGINIGLCNFRGEIVNLKTRIPHKFENTKESFNTICAIIKDFIKAQDVKEDKILNVQINISGRVNPKTGYSYSIFYFDETPLSEHFSKKIGHHVSIDNDTRAMTYGEYLSGNVTEEKNIIFVNLSWGIAIGIIINGQIYTGKSGFAGEFGHVKAFDNEVICHCGKKGCIETEISGSYLYKTLLEEINNGAVSTLSQTVKKREITLNDIIDAVVDKEDVLCIKLVEEIGSKLGEQLAMLINIFNPESIIIGGTLSEAKTYLIPPIKTTVRRYSLNLVSRDSQLLPSKFTGKSGVIGACLLSRKKIFDDV